MAEIDDVFNMLGFGRMQITIFIGCLMMQIWFTTEQLGVGIVLMAAACDLDVNDYKLAWFSALTFAVQIVAFIFWGVLVDALGRRKMIMYTGVTSTACSILSAGMPEFLSFFALRIICSAFIAAPVITLMSYMGEFTKQSLRPKVLNFLSYGVGISFILVPSVAYFLLPLKLPGAQNWRILLLINQVPGIIGLAIISFMPESPKYYLSVHRQEDAMEVMERCCRLNKGKDTNLESLGVKELTQPRLRAQSIKTATFNFCPNVLAMFKEHTRIMVIQMLSKAIMSGIGFGLQVWMLRIRFTMKSDGYNGQTVCQHVQSNVQSGKHECHVSRSQLEDPIINGFLLSGIFILTSILLLCMGRRLVIHTFIAISMLSNISVNFLAEDTIILFALFLIPDPLLSNLRLVQTVVIDMIPTHYRAKATSMGNVAGRSGILFTSLFMGYTLTWNCYVAFNTFLVISLLGALLVSFLPSESTLRETIKY